jgi:cobalt-zinc-cadmium efflux system protein
VFWHIIADMMGVIALIVSGFLDLFFHWDLADPIITLFIAALILVSSVRLAFKVFRVLLETVPPHLDMYRLCHALEDIEGVTLVHDVHAWTITTGYDALTAHILIDPDYDRSRLRRPNRTAAAQVEANRIRRLRRSPHHVPG